MTSSESWRLPLAGFVVAGLMACGGGPQGFGPSGSIAPEAIGPAGGPEPYGRFVVGVGDDRVDVDASNAALGDVLRALTEPLGVVLRASGGLDEPVTVHLSDMSFEGAVSRLLGNRGFTVRYGVGSSRPEVLYVFARQDRADAGRAMLDLSLTAPDPVTRVGAVLGLASAEDLPADALAERLQGVLHDASPAVRDFAIVALGELDGDGALAPLTDLLRDDDSEVRESVVQALAERRDASSLNVLRLALDDFHPDVRTSAAAALTERRIRDR